MSDKVLSQFKPETHEENTIDCSRRLKFPVVLLTVSKKLPFFSLSYLILSFCQFPR